jgi:hypothetical protein
LAFAVQSYASNDVVKMVGEITAIDPVHKTVVVEVPVGKAGFGEQLFTVGGTLSPDVELRRAGRSAELNDFYVGEEVTVWWKTIDTGHLTVSLEAQ